MKFQSYKYGLAIAVFLVCINETFAQQRPTTRRPASNSAYEQLQKPQPKLNTTSAYGDTIPGGDNKVSVYGEQSTTLVGIDTSLPMTVVQSSGGLFDTVKMSLRTDGAFERNLIKDATPLPYEDIREDDAVYVVRVWREIDAREKLNLTFRYAVDEDDGNQRFIAILLNAIKEGDVTAFSGDDDRFTTPITADDAVNAFGGGSDTSTKYDLEGNIAGYEVRSKAVDPDSIYKFRLKEEWVFDKESSRLFVRIIGIAPVIPYKLSTGEIVPGSDRAVWWIYYPDLRPVLTKYDVYNPKNFSSKMTWEELFENRMFSSYITKTTLDNPFDKTLASLYPNNTLFRLLEGEKVKEKIFDYEQALWSY